MTVHQAATGLALWGVPCRRATAAEGPAAAALTAGTSAFIK